MPLPRADVKNRARYVRSSIAMPAPVFGFIFRGGIFRKMRKIQGVAAPSACMRTMEWTVCNSRSIVQRDETRLIAC
jgi:hypothetical protein